MRHNRKETLMARLSSFNVFDVRAHDFTAEAWRVEDRNYIDVTIGDYPNVVLRLAGDTRTELVDELTAIADTLAHAADRIANEVTA